MIQNGEANLKDLLTKEHPPPPLHQIKRLDQIQLKSNEKTYVHLFISSTFLDTHVERDLIVNKIVPEINSQFLEWNLVIIPIDLRQGVDEEQYGDYCAIQKLCFDKIDECRLKPNSTPWFIGLRTKRYGWVETELLEPDCYPFSYNHTWIDTLRSNFKHVSITSLECIHATHPVQFVEQSPTIFFYERLILNENDIDEESSWIYDFNYKLSGPCNETQYTIHCDAESYKKDRDSLNDYLKTGSSCKYQSYSCKYQKKATSNGKGTMIPQRLTNLDDLKLMIKKDLIQAIERNFINSALAT